MASEVQDRAMDTTSLNSARGTLGSRKQLGWVLAPVDVSMSSVGQQLFQVYHWITAWRDPIAAFAALSSCVVKTFLFPRYT